MTESPRVLQVKLTTGQDIVGIEDSDSTDEFLVLKYAMEVQKTIDLESSKTGWILAKFAVFTPNGLVKLSKNHILTAVEVYPEFKDYYLYSVMTYSRDEEPEFRSDIKRSLRRLAKKYTTNSDALYNFSTALGSMNEFGMPSLKVH